MSLISILVFAVAALAVVSGLSAFVGAAKHDRVRMAWFFATMLFGAVWGVSIAVFLGLPAQSDHLAPTVIAGIYLGGALMMLCLAGYGCWNSFPGKILVGASLVYVAVLTTMVSSKPELMFEGFTLTSRGNSVQLVNGWAYWTYGAYFAIDTGIVWLSILKHAKNARSKRVRQGDYVLLGGLAVTGVLAGIFDVVMPLFVRYDLVWMGPLALSTTAIAFCYALLRFRIVSIESRWLKVISAAMLMICGAIVYMLIFYIIFTALFKIPNPSASVLVLNFLMIVIVLLLMPVINELGTAMRSLISVGQVDIAYVIKKLNRLASKNVDLRDLAGFLADHLHFAYIGFIINGKLYGSKAFAVSSDELKQITSMKAAPRSDAWQEPNKTTQKTLDELGIKAVAELRNAKGKPFGQIVVGQPLGKKTFERRDLIQLEMIINLVATVIDSEKHIRA